MGRDKPVWVRTRPIVAELSSGRRALLRASAALSQSAVRRKKAARALLSPTEAELRVGLRWTRRHARARALRTRAEELRLLASLASFWAATLESVIEDVKGRTRTGPDEAARLTALVWAARQVIGTLRRAAR
jgi:hypothetical protein